MTKVSDIDFIDGTHRLMFIPDGRKSKFKITRDNETREYSATQYLRLLLEVGYVHADKTKYYRKKMHTFARTEGHLKRVIFRFGLNDHINTSEIFEDIKAQEKIISTYYEKGEQKKAFWRGFTVAIIAALIGATPQIIQESRKQPQDKYIVVPKTQIVHDTVQAKPDTTLVRFVKRKKHP